MWPDGRRPDPGATDIEADIEAPPRSPPQPKKATPTTTTVLPGSGPRSSRAPTTTSGSATSSTARSPSSTRPPETTLSWPTRAQEHRPNTDTSRQEHDADGDADDLSDVVEDDVFKATVTVLGSYSYDTQIGGNTTVPHLQINKIKVIGNNTPPAPAWWKLPATKPGAYTAGPPPRSLPHGRFPKPCGRPGSSVSPSRNLRLPQRLQVQTV